ncbi:hypothetical protein ASPZODRAFT_71867 [Penicilliopsis zonata CBS 506.65]|uniref:Cenp-O kinetochore centromere component n=1 Tax=Penicilliopsis zonata CBS 506.65 TaxID=1073090 RepID=A0A1L9SAQ6_9EURO|nr:hypothetical protein ASPZODRAFT_71867 [Penicilliopsis zonata CBS 506.65]OJJ44244.1 hypothetical protein ASPZODRAFT_71867 [Penicilliopsis zonata CBS 506.65]
MEELDAEISSVRAEIENLRKRKRFLTSSLLSSEPIQTRLASAKQAAASSAVELDVSPLIETADAHVSVNHHRIAFSTTTFPFHDPSPHADDASLLGVRIDICRRTGHFTKPYYILLKREGNKKDTTNRVGKRNRDPPRLRVHRHTIPAFIPLDSLAEIYLPSQAAHHKSSREDSDEEELKPPQTRKQDLPAFVREIRRELVAWHLRLDAVEFLKEELAKHTESIPAESEGERIVSLAATALEARYIRLEWADGRVGRFKVSDSGRVERAVVIGDSGRDKALEYALTGGDARVESVLNRLLDTVVK